MRIDILDRIRQLIEDYRNRVFTGNTTEQRIAWEERKLRRVKAGLSQELSLLPTEFKPKVVTEMAQILSCNNLLALINLFDELKSLCSLSHIESQEVYEQLKAVIIGSKMDNLESLEWLKKLRKVRDEVRHAG